MTETAGQAGLPLHAYNRRQKLEADIKLGALELWTGIGRNQSWPWLDVAVRVGKGWGVVADHYGAMIQRPDFIGFLPALRAFAAGETNEASVRSTGGSMQLTLRRSEPGWLRGEINLDQGPNSQLVRFQLWEDSVREAVPTWEAAVARIEAAWIERWKPRFGKQDLSVHAALIDAPQPPTQFKAWDSGMVDGEDVRITYGVDGYGWYEGSIEIGGNTGHFGGGYLTDAKGDLIRAALMLLTGKRYAEVICNAEPGITRIEFEVANLRVEEGPEPGVPGAMEEACWVRIREIDYQTGEEQPPEFDGLARSPRAVAEAIHAMAVRAAEADGGPWSDAIKVLDAALASLPQNPR